MYDRRLTQLGSYFDMPASIGQMLSSSSIDLLHAGEELAERVRKATTPIHSSPDQIDSFSRDRSFVKSLESQPPTPSLMSQVWNHRSVVGSV